MRIQNTILKLFKLSHKESKPPVFNTKRPPAEKSSTPPPPPSSQSFLILGNPGGEVDRTVIPWPN